MPQQIIDTGTSPNDGTGEGLRNAFEKTNANFGELYTLKAPLNAPVLTGGVKASADLTTNPTTGVFAQLEVIGASAPAKRLALGFNTTAGTGVIQAVEDGVAFRSLLLNPSGGNVGIGSTSVGFKLTVAGSLGPATDNTSAIGSPSARYTDIHATRIRPGAATAIWTSGTGTPEGTVVAPIGSLFTRTDGGVNTTLYVKESGTGNTGWVPK